MTRSSTANTAGPGPSDAPLPLVIGAMLLIIALVGSQAVLGGDWATFAEPERRIFAAVAIVGAFMGGLLLRDWRWPLATALSLIAFALLALTWIAREQGAAGAGRAWRSWGIAWPLLVGLAALLGAGVAAGGVFSAEVLAARRKGASWQTQIPPRLVGLGPAVLGGAIFFVLLSGAWAVGLPSPVPFWLTLLITPVAVGGIVHSYWWVLAAPLAVIAMGLIRPTGMEYQGGLYEVVSILFALPVAGLAALGVWLLGPAIAKRLARS